MEVLFSLCGNEDLKPYMGEVLSCARGKKDVGKCVNELAGVVFVQEFEAPALAVLMPVLVKALKSRNMRTQRQACVIAANVCSLVPSSADVQPFLLQLQPLLKRASEETADPEVRAVAGRAHASLARVADADLAGAARSGMRTAISAAALMAETEARDGCGDVFNPCPAPVREVICDYVVTICVGLATCQTLSQSAWKQRLMKHLEPLVGTRAEKLVGELRGIGSALSSKTLEQKEKCGFWEDENESDEDNRKNVICDCTLTLACGAATLLNRSHLRLTRGRVYGLVGANDSGKSTLLRALHDRRVVGFPSASELTSALVEHGVGEKAPECDLTPLDYLASDQTIRALDVPRTQIEDALRDLGFGQDGRMKRPIKTLSGGWKMKLGLACAMLQTADLLLLDEPTGHLDTKNVEWLVGYIKSLQEDEQAVTTIIVSHNISFLDEVCTHIVHVQDQKLRTFCGNFAQFIERVPDAQLGTTIGEEEKPISAFTLPAPGQLEGVRSAGKRFLHLENVFYSYPNAGSPAVRGATVECSLKSRVAIVGPNGAGKSTLAALIVGELAPDLGTAWRHPNLRIVMVAQHTFRHLETHMDLTATQYILWRFEGNEDREAMEFMADEAEIEETRAYRLADGHLIPCDADDADMAVPDAVLDRRQLGRLGYEYEVRWRETHGNRAATSWVPRWQLAAMGYLAMARREDAHQAAQQSLVNRPLTTPAVEAHLAGFGLDAEEATHRRLGALSNGQRARAVLAAATWLAPHLLVLDEPSNYLDQPALAALAAGLQNFSGGVMVISHNEALLDQVCTSKWVMEGGRLRCEGAAAAEDATDNATAGAPTKTTSKYTAAAAAAVAAREKKKQKRMLELRRKNGEAVPDDDEWYDNLLKKANAKVSDIWTQAS